MCLRTNPEPVVVNGVEKFGAAIERSRYGYRWLPNGRQNYTRVTSIVKHVGGSPDGLMKWVSKQVADAASEVGQRLLAGTIDVQQAGFELSSDRILQAAEKERDRAGDFGTTGHRFIEAWVSGSPFDYERLTEPLVKRVQFFADWNDRVRPTYHALEFFVWHDLLLYAGACDCLCTIGGDLWMLDWKTSKSLRREYVLQLAGYQFAERCGWADGASTKVPMAMRHGIVWLTDEGLFFNEVPCRKDVEFARFLECLNLYRYAHEKKDPWSLVDSQKEA